MNQRPWEPSRGCLVRYRGELFYFQPMGSACYLYDHADEVGRPQFRRYYPGKKQVYQPDKEQIAHFLRTPRPRRQMKEIEKSSSSSSSSSSSEDESSEDPPTRSLRSPSEKSSSSSSSEELFVRFRPSRYRIEKSAPDSAESREDIPF